jgi:hypothetical protein
MDNFREDLIKTLESTLWERPTEDKYPKMTLKNVAKRTTKLGLKTTIWFEDIHWVWRNYKPNNA